jgi:2,3-bisphosphoglycerate-independent phosphoglycerate mutase
MDAIQMVDREVVSRLCSLGSENLRILAMPDHPTPIATQTHSTEPVPFVMWGAGCRPNGAKRFTEAEAKDTGVLIEEGHTVMARLIEG